MERTGSRPGISLSPPAATGSSEARGHAESVSRRLWRRVVRLGTEVGRQAYAVGLTGAAAMAERLNPAARRRAQRARRSRQSRAGACACASRHRSRA
ncbi:hypothetical protein [Streptomyces sp. SYSU K217416]